MEIIKKNKERWIGYFLGPALVATVNGAVGGRYPGDHQEFKCSYK